MPVTLRDKTDVSSVQEFRPETAVRPKHGRVHVAVDNVLPFTSIGMPMQFSPFATAFEYAVRCLGKHPKLVGLRRSNPRVLQIFRYFLRRNRSAREVNLLLRKTIKR